MYKALEVSPHDTGIMDALAELLVGLGHPEEAYSLLLNSTTLAPHTGGATKW